MAKKTALILGSSGLVGKELLDLCLKSEVYEKVITAVRTSVLIQDEKHVELIIDFEMPPWDDLFPVDHVYCCLGTTIKKAGSKSNFRKVDHDFPLAFAGAAKKWEVEQFSVITAAGVSAESKIFYNKVKGELELNLKNLALKSTLIFQPSLLLGDRSEYRLGEIIFSRFAKIFSWITPNSIRAIHCKKVAKSMLEKTISAKKGFNIITNKKMHEIV
jgi:uncharacterized protein YbjT (DUF2867 family)